MIDVGSIQAAVTSLKTATDIAKGFLDLRNLSEVQGKVVELQAEILAAQTSALAAQSDQMALLDHVRGLEAQVAQMKAWEAEKERYELRERATGIVAYRLKDEARGTEPTHWICATCYERSTKSILQLQLGSERSRILLCPRCKTSLRTFDDLYD